MKRKPKFKVGQVTCDTSDGMYMRVAKVLKDGIYWCQAERYGSQWTVLERHMRPLTKRERGQL